MVTPPVQTGNEATPSQWDTKKPSVLSKTSCSSDEDHPGFCSLSESNRFLYLDKLDKNPVLKYKTFDLQQYLNVVSWELIQTEVWIFEPNWSKEGSFKYYYWRTVTMWPWTRRFTVKKNTLNSSTVTRGPNQLKPGERWTIKQQTAGHEESFPEVHAVVCTAVKLWWCV